MARIDYPHPDSLNPETRDRLRRMGSLNVTRMMSHAEGVMLAYSKLGTQLLLRGALDPVLREAVILRVGQLCSSDYEWHQHVSVARAVGMDEATLDAIARKAFDTLTEPYRVALRLAEEIDADGAASPDGLAAAAQWFSPAELVELVILIGYYRLTAGFLRSFDIEIEETAPLGAAMQSDRETT